MSVTLSSVRRVDDRQFSFALDLHLVARGLWRALYVACFLISVMDKGKGLEGSFADNLPHLAGLLQVMINFELFSGAGYPPLHLGQHRRTAPFGNYFESFVVRDGCGEQ